MVPLFSACFFACKKDEVQTPSIAEFVTASTTASYFVTNSPNTVYKIPVGITTPSNKDRVINFTVSSPTGAKEGEQYTIASKSITIPAGNTVDSIAVKGLFAGYPVGRKDTLIFQITGGDAQLSSKLPNTYKLVLQKYCDVDLNSFLGDYNNSSNSATGAKYKITVTSVQSTSATTGYMMITGLYNGISSAVRVNLDWTNPANFTTTVVGTTNIYTDATYGAVNVRAINTGTFSSCLSTFTLSYQRYVSAGNFTANVTTMAR